MKTSPATHTPDTLDAVIGDISAALRNVQAVAETLKQSGLDRVRIKAGQAEMKRALIGLKNFAGYLEKAIRDARDERGDFGADHIENDRAPKRRKKKSA